MFSAVRAYQIAVVFHNTQHIDFHHLCHLISFTYNHLYQILRGRYDHDTFYRQRLEYCQRYITGSRRHIYEQIVQISPDHIGPELFYHICQNRSSPDDRFVFSRKQQVYRHYLNAVFCLDRIDTGIYCLCRALDTIHLRDGGSCDIRIQDTYFVTFLYHSICQRCGNEGFTNAAFSADDANHMFYVGLAVHLFQHTLGLFAWTSFTAFFAAGCVATFFCHCLSSFLFLFHKAIDCFVQFFQCFHIPILNCIHNTMLYVIL